MGIDFKQKIPFFESIDDVHCFQACLKMVLSYWLAQEQFSFQKLDEVSGHGEHKWTWQGQAILYLVNRGFKIINIENLDYKSFAENGTSYLRTIWSEDVYQIQSEHSDLDQEYEVAKTLVRAEAVTLCHREVTLKDVVDLMQDGYVVLVSVNPYKLRAEAGCASHMVVITQGF